MPFYSVSNLHFICNLKGRKIIAKLIIGWPGSIRLTSPSSQSFSQKMKTATAAMAIAAGLLALGIAQDIDSSYPSRTTILALSDQPKANASVVNHIRTHTRDRTVLGYVTPWNPKGTTLSEAYRGKFDIISPAWHTVDVVHTGGKTFYQVGGAIPSTSDEEWMRRMQGEAKDGNGHLLQKIRITPRYVLDRFSPEDLVELLSSDEFMEAVARSIIESVEEHKYDGVVFECAAIWAIEKLVLNLATKLHDQGKIIITVIPAMRKNTDAQTIQSNKITEHAMATLSPIVDYIMIMTYDHAGQQGNMYQDIYNVSTLPEGSPLRQDGVRCPGPNTPLDFLAMNAEMLSGDLELLSEPMVMQSSSGGFSLRADNVQRKMLMGFSLYGYTYPIGWFDQSSNSSQGVPRIPPSSPIGSKDNDTEAQAASRERAKKWELQTSTIVPVLRFPAEPFKQDDLISILKTSKALIRLDEASQEQYFDYVAMMPESLQPKLTEEEKKIQSKPLASYYRAYFPSAHTIRKRLEALQDFPEIGISAWDVGQAGEWLLQNL